MGCCDHFRSGDTVSGIKPDEPCIHCAEKHLATAYALHLEIGYTVENRARIIGELVLAQWHVFHTNRGLCKLIRDARHSVQSRSETEVDWMPMLEEIDRLAAAEAKKILEEEQTNKKEA